LEKLRKENNKENNLYISISVCRSGRTLVIRRETGRGVESLKEKKKSNAEADWLFKAKGEKRRSGRSCRSGGRTGDGRKTTCNRGEEGMKERENLESRHGENRHIRKGREKPGETLRGLIADHEDLRAFSWKEGSDRRLIESLSLVPARTRALKTQKKRKRGGRGEGDRDKLFPRFFKKRAEGKYWRGGNGDEGLQRRRYQRSKRGVE